MAAPHQAERYTVNLAPQILAARRRLLKIAADALRGIVLGDGYGSAYGYGYAPAYSYGYPAYYGSYSRPYYGAYAYAGSRAVRRVVIHRARWR